MPGIDPTGRAGGLYRHFSSMGTGDERAWDVHPGAVDESETDRPAKAEPVSPSEAESLPPVVARLVVEIRSDGSRTVARGALEDAVSGQDVAVAVEAESPAALLGKLTRSLISLPSMIRPREALPEADANTEARPSLRSLGRRLKRRLTRRR